MSADKKLPVVLCWHMHQPDYRDRLAGVYTQPWTYLHAIKDYTDMAAHLEANPAAKAVVNFAPVLLEQIEDYANQVDAWLGGAAPLHDPLLAALAGPTLPDDATQRKFLLAACLRANASRMIEPNPVYAELAQLARWLQSRESLIDYIDEQFFADLLVWYHLAWLGETVRRKDRRARALLDQGRRYTSHHRRELVGLIGDLCRHIVPRYRRLHETGRVELSVTPQTHPILPLLVDLASARQAMPAVTLPAVENYPGGDARARDQIARGLETFERYFGHRPAGCWPAEGGVSLNALAMLQAAGFRWSASGGGVLHNSRVASGADSQNCIHHPYSFDPGGPVCFFRDDGLSDLIGFTYADWSADDAVADLVKHIEGIAARCDDLKNAVVPIILDGENAWEHYPANGLHFLTALYRRLGDHPQIELTTFGELLDRGIEAVPIRQMVAGSWVYGTFSTWIGDADKNRAWEMLIDAKRCYDRVFATGRLSAKQRARATEQLAVCEGSDWFWWFGDYNPSETVVAFDQLYRRHLGNLYQVLGEQPPGYLAQGFSHGGGDPARGGTMRPGLSTA